MTGFTLMLSKVRILLWILPLILLPAAGCTPAATEDDPHAGHSAETSPPAPEGHDHGGGGHGQEAPGSHAHGEEGSEAHEDGPSDLDRPVEELLEDACEHEMATYTCDECRYEVGMVKVGGELLGGAGTIDTTVVGSRAIAQILRLDGEVALDASQSAHIDPRAAGIVRAVYVDLGSVVRAGEILFAVDSPEFTEAKAELKRARAARRLAQATSDREAGLYAQQICPEKDLLEARAALEAAEADEKAATERLLGYGLRENALEEILLAPAGSPKSYLPVCAPFAGTVLERDLNLGAAVEPGDQLLLLAEVSRLWVLTNLYERELALLLESRESGEIRAEVEVPAYPGRVFSGRLDRLGGTLDEATRTTKARVLVENPGNLLRAGMFARVRLHLAGSEQALAVPAEAVLDDEGRSFVFIRALPSYFVRRPVQAGRAWGDWVEIAEGLHGGETVATRGAFLLKSDVLRSKMGAGCAD